mgnify:CR=1 FL=1
MRRRAERSAARCRCASAKHRSAAEVPGASSQAVRKLPSRARPGSSSRLADRRIPITRRLRASRRRHRNGSSNQRTMRCMPPPQQCSRTREEGVALEFHSARLKTGRNWHLGLLSPSMRRRRGDFNRRTLQRPARQFQRHKSAGSRRGTCPWCLRRGQRAGFGVPPGQEAKRPVRCLFSPLFPRSRHRHRTIVR